LAKVLLTLLATMAKTNAFPLALLFVGSFLGSLAACASQPRPEPPQQPQFLRAITAPSRLEPAEPLPEGARAILRTRMASHARDMGDLMSAIMILRYREIEERANDIANESQFARPLTNDATELNAALPEKFFVYQRELRVLAASLATAAHALDAFKVASAYGQVSETCVKCHATYRAERQQPAMPANGIAQ
jgi:hypothetical protein